MHSGYHNATQLYNLVSGNEGQKQRQETTRANLVNAGHSQPQTGDSPLSLEMSPEAVSSSAGNSVNCRATHRNTCAPTSGSVWRVGSKLVYKQGALHERENGLIFRCVCRNARAFRQGINFTIRHLFFFVQNTTRVVVVFNNIDVLTVYPGSSM